jgi:hypothetical protein
MTQLKISATPNGTGLFTLRTPVSNTDRLFTLPDIAGTILIDSQIATQEEATTGTDNTKLMTPLRVAQATSSISSPSWTSISGKPTTLSGFGITDAISTADTQSNNIAIRNTSPTIYLRDTDNTVGMIHVNSNTFYVLRGAADSTTWTAVNGVWPMTLNLNTNDVTFGGNVGAYSDERLKSNIRTIDNALDKVSSMRGVYFDRDGKASVGVIAQEMAKVLPEVVSEVSKDSDYLSVTYGNIVGVLIEAIKELKAEIEKLKKG